jgi:hypothetical protein
MISTGGGAEKPSTSPRQGADVRFTRFFSLTVRKVLVSGMPD